MGARNSANDVVGVLNIGDPIAHCFVERIFECF